MKIWDPVLPGGSSSSLAGLAVATGILGDSPREVSRKSKPRWRIERFRFSSLIRRTRMYTIWLKRYLAETIKLIDVVKHQGFTTVMPFRKELVPQFEGLRAFVQHLDHFS